MNTGEKKETARRSFREVTGVVSEVCYETERDEGQYISLVRVESF